jgi:hypothetical protein
MLSTRVVEKWSIHCSRIYRSWLLKQICLYETWDQDITRFAQLYRRSFVTKYICRCDLHTDVSLGRKTNISKKIMWEKKANCEMGIWLPDPSNYFQYASTYGSCFIRRHDGGGSEPVGGVGSSLYRRVTDPSIRRLTRTSNSTEPANAVILSTFTLSDIEHSHSRTLHTWC